MAPVFRCVTDGSLVPSPKIGDGAYDCPDGSDESYLVRRKEEAAKEEVEDIKETMRGITEENKENGIETREEQEAGGGDAQQDLGNLAGGGDSSTTNPYLSGGGGREEGAITRGATGGGNSGQPPASCWNIDLSDLPTLVILGKYISLFKENFNFFLFLF